ncbi:MAG: DNA polymerase III subunit delta [Pseudomonadota bacterium]
MKLSARDAKAYFAKPDPNKSGVLIYGPDPMRTALRRQELIDALIGPNGDDEMRLTRMQASDVRKDPTLLNDALKAQGFFPGPRVVFVEDATDAINKHISAALEDWQVGDATLVITAGQLTPRSGLRKLFEAHPNAYSAPVFADPPSRSDVEASLQKVGLRDVSTDAMSTLVDLARVLDPGDFAQTVEKISLYKIGDPDSVSAEDVTACAPLSTEAELDDALDCVAEGRAHELGPVLRRLEAQGVAAVRLCIGATQHFRKLHVAASDPSGPEAGIAKARPPAPYPRRDRMVRQARAWGPQKLEAALRVLTDTDLSLRSSKPHPPMALIERALIRLAMMSRR